MNIRFLKIKATKDNKINIVYELKNGRQWDEYSLISSSESKPSFHESLQNLAQDVLEMCELPVDYQKRIKVKGVSFSYGGKKEVMGATLIAQMTLYESNVALNLNTPHKAEEYYAETGDSAQLLSKDCVNRINILTEEAEDYIKGVRAQIDMFQEVAA